MTQCDHLQVAYDKAVEAGNETAAAAILLAMEASGCGVSTQGGGVGNGPPIKP